MAWTKGQSGNPSGRPISENRRLLEKAIATVERKRKKKFWLHVVERAYDDDGVLKAVLDKLVPDLKALEGVLDLNVQSLADIAAVMRSRTGRGADHGG